MILKTSKNVPDRLETAPPAIGKGGNWWAYDDKTGKFADTGVKAKGDKGDKGDPGTDGKDGTSQYTKTVVDARGLDENKYYLVTFTLSETVNTGLWVNKILDGKTASWQTHHAGSTLTLHWEERGMGWGAAHNDRKIITYSELFSSVLQAGSLDQVSFHSTGVIYVRGGATYRFITANVDGTPGPVPSLQKNDYVFIFEGRELARCPATKDSVERIVTDKEKADQKANELRAALDNANTLIEGLSTIRDEIRNGTVEPRKFKDIQYLLDALQKDGSFKTGILLSSVIALSGKDGNISSYLSGARGDGIAMLRAGVEHFGGADGNPETAQTTIWSDGSVDIGDMHFVNEKDHEADHIDFTDKAADHTYLQIGGAPKTESEMLFQSSVPSERELEPVYHKTTGTHLIANVLNTEGNRTITFTGTITAFAKASAQRVEPHPGAQYIQYPGTRASQGAEPRPGDPYIQYTGTRASVSAYVKAEAYSGEILKNTYTSPTLYTGAEVKGFTQKPTEIPPLDKMRQEVTEELPFTLSVPAASAGDRIIISLVVTTTTSYPDYAFAYAGVKKGIKASYPSSNQKSLVSIMRDKVAFFFSRQKYLLFNYLSDYLVKIVGNVLVQGNLKADRIDTDRINGGLPVKVLAHGVWPKSGGYVRYTSAVGGSISISRIGDGIYYLYYPTTWDYTHLSFLGTANSLTFTGTINTGNIAFSKAESGRVKVFTGDDSSGNDSDVYFQIILRDFSN